MVQLNYIHADVLNSFVKTEPTLDDGVQNGPRSDELFHRSDPDNGQEVASQPFENSQDIVSPSWWSAERDTEVFPTFGARSKPYTAKRVREKSDGDLELKMEHSPEHQQLALPTYTGPLGNSRDAQPDESEIWAPPLEPTRKKGKKRASSSQVPVHDDATDDEMPPLQIGRASEELPTLMVKPSQTIHFHDTDKVKACLKSMLTMLDQPAGVRIARAWIGGICPAKPKEFPYGGLKGEDKQMLSPKLPGWWPSTQLCPFKRPDHIRKNQLIELLLHLLRLRVSTEELQTMNGRGEGTWHPSSSYLEESWTVFLKGLFQTTEFDSPSYGDEEKRKKGRRILTTMYDVAQKEEDYLLRGVDYGYFNWDEGDDYEKPSKPAKNRPVKRRRRALREPRLTDQQSPIDPLSSFDHGIHPDQADFIQTDALAGATSHVAPGMFIPGSAVSGGEIFTSDESGYNNQVAGMDMLSRNTMPDGLFDPIFYETGVPDLTTLETPSQASVQQGQREFINQTVEDYRSRETLEGAQPDFLNDEVPPATAPFDRTITEAERLIHPMQTAQPGRPERLDGMPEWSISHEQPGQTYGTTQCPSPSFEYAPNTPTYLPAADMQDLFPDFGNFGNEMLAETINDPLYLPQFVGNSEAHGATQPDDQDDIAFGPVLQPQHPQPLPTALPHGEGKQTYGLLQLPEVNTLFEGPARATRGFTGHSSGVGGGQPT